jgi:hypothetical protein
MRTIEVFIVAAILFVAFATTSHFATLPSPRNISGSNMRQLALSTLETINVNGSLSRTVFSNPSDSSWTSLQIALASSLPPNVVYNLSVYKSVNSSGVFTYRLVHSLSNSGSDLGTGSDASSYLVASPNTTFTATPKNKIGESMGKNITLYILNCNDANGWWITGYTAQSLASDLCNLLSPYFQRTILVNTTEQLGRLLDNTTLEGERLRDAVVINTFGEAVPIPTSYANMYSRDSYAEYCYQVGKKVNQYNWTWASIVGWPFYYVSNTAKFSGSENSYGIYGMVKVDNHGLHAFLDGLDNQTSYSYGNSQTGNPGVVYLSSDAQDCRNYYGIYPAPYQTSTRALPRLTLETYNLNWTSKSLIFTETSDHYFAGGTYSHKDSSKIYGSFTAIGLTRTPDIRITALAILQYYRPTIYPTVYEVVGTSRLVVLQLAQQGGV